MDEILILLLFILRTTTVIIFNTNHIKLIMANDRKKTQKHKNKIEMKEQFIYIYN